MTKSGNAYVYWFKVKLFCWQIMARLTATHTLQDEFMEVLVTGWDRHLEADTDGVIDAGLVLQMLQAELERRDAFKAVTTELDRLKKLKALRGE